MARINELWKGTKIVYGKLRHRQDQGSVERLMETSRTCSTPDSGMWRRSAVSGSVSYLMYSPLPIYHLSLKEPASEAEVDRRTGSAQAYFS